MNKVFILLCLPFFYLLSCSVIAQEVKANHLFTLSKLRTEHLLLPTDVATDGRQIYVVDSGNNRIAVFDLQGMFIKVIGQEGSEQGEFKDPIGIFIDQDRQLYVADTANHRVQIFDADGNFQSLISLVSGENKIRPVDIAVDPSTKNIYVSGNNNHRLMVFNQQGNLLHTWGKNGSDEGEFRYPATIDLTKDSRIAIVDVLNTRVQLLKSDGSFLTEIGEWGVLPGQLFRPKGVAIDTQDRIYISDSYMNVIQIFSDDGTFMQVLKRQDSTDFDTPVGMTIDNHNRLYVTEMLENRVTIFQLE